MYDGVNTRTFTAFIVTLVLVSLAGLALGILVQWEWGFHVFLIAGLVPGFVVGNRVSNSIVNTYERELPLARARVKARLEGISRAIDVSRPADLSVSWFDEQAGFVVGKTVPGAGVMACPSCGALAGTIDRFCASCGARLGT